MVKLVDILAEIRVVSSSDVNPEDVKQQWGLCAFIHFHNYEGGFEEFDNLEKKWRNKYNFPKSTYYELTDYIAKTNKKDLVLLSHELKNYANKYKLDEIRIVRGRNVIAQGHERGDIRSKKSYVVDLGDGSTFTIHKHKNHATLYPSFNILSPKYAKIKDFLKSKGIPFEEFSKWSHDKTIANVRIKNPDIFLNFLEKNIEPEQ